MTPHGVPIPEWIEHMLDVHGPEGLAFVDGSGVMLGCNVALARMLGQERPDDWFLRPVGQALGWTEEGQPGALFAEARSKGNGRIPGSLTHSDGSLITCSITAVLASRPGETPSYFLHIRHADAMGAQRKLMELQVQHRMVLQRAGGLVLMVDPNSGAVLHANEAAQEYLRLPLAAIRGGSLLDLLEGVEAMPSGGGLEQLLNPGVRELELSIPSSTGSSFVLQMACNSVSWHGRRALLWIGRDVSDRRAAAPPPEEAALGLRIPTAVVVPVAENIRYPASKVEQLARHCLDHPEWPWRQMRPRLEQIQELSDDVRSGSQDLLYLSRLTTGTLDVRRTETTVGSLLGHVLPSLQRVARTRGGDLLTVQVDEDATLYTDPRLLGHSLRRFIERAVSFEGVTLTLTAAVEGDCIRFTLIDNAPALSPDRVADVLSDEGLHHTDVGIEVPAAVTALKLAVHLVRTLGGHAELQSSEGMGTRVSLTLLS